MNQTLVYDSFNIKFIKNKLILKNDFMAFSKKLYEIGRFMKYVNALSYLLFQNAKISNKSQEL